MKLELRSQVADFLAAMETFSLETDYDLTYDPEGAHAYTWQLLGNDETAIFVNYDDDVIRGFAIVHKDKEFQKEYIGFLSKFYILPTGRKTKASRELMQEVVQWFDKSNCVYSFATATANIGQDTLFINLLKKFGYKMVGTALIRKPNE